MPITVLDGPTIDAGESLSDFVDLGDGVALRITMPAAWDDAVLTFQISTDGQYYNDLFRHDGWESSFHVVPGTAVLLPPEMMRAVRFLKLRSGTRDNPIPQSEARLFALTVETS